MSTKNTGARSSKTVTVACKVPGGLILRGFRMEDRQEPVMGGGMRSFKIAVETGERVIINGPVAERGKMPLARNDLGMPDERMGMVRVEYGFALTHGIDAEFFAEWLEQNRTLEAVKNGLIFAHAQQASVVAKARDGENIRSGLEPIDPENPGRTGLKVEPTDEQKKRLVGERLKAKAA